MQDVENDLKTTDQIAGWTLQDLENDGLNRRTGKCKSKSFCVHASIIPWTDRRTVAPTIVIVLCIASKLC